MKEEDEEERWMGEVKGNGEEEEGSRDGEEARNRRWKNRKRKNGKKRGKEDADLPLISALTSLLKHTIKSAADV